MEMNIKYGVEILLILKGKDIPIIYSSDSNIKQFIDKTVFDASCWKKVYCNEDVIFSIKNSTSHFIGEAKEIIKSQSTI